MNTLKIYGFISDDSCLIKDRCSHIDGCHEVTFIVVSSADCHDSCQRLNLECFCFSVFFIKCIFCETADAVSAHFCFAAVRLEQAHFHISGIGFADEKNSVSSYAETAVAECFGEFRLHLIRYDYCFHLVNEDEIIADITEENGFADIEVASGEGRDG